MEAVVIFHREHFSHRVKAVETSERTDEPLPVVDYRPRLANDSLLGGPSQQVRCSTGELRSADELTILHRRSDRI